jgi:cyclophilin family peptidyl-prolyl cis-trans isomerase
MARSFTKLLIKGADGGLMRFSPQFLHAVNCCYFRLSARKLFRAAGSLLIAALCASASIAEATIVRMETNGLGGFNIELYDADAPQTVANFLKYMARGAASGNGGYDGTIIHRQIPGFIVQGGGYGCCYFDGNPVHIAIDPPVPNEFSPSRSNVRGTIAMAKLAGDPDSATSEWFINLADNSANLDFQNGGFTVFGRVLDRGMDVVDEIATLSTSNQDAYDESFTIITLDSVPKLGNSFVFVTRICINDDGDGACSDTEDLAPNGDGDGDGTPDRNQANVVSMPTIFGTVATFSADTGIKFDSAGTLDTNTALSLVSKFAPPPDSRAHFNNGMFAFTMTGAMGSAGQIVTLHDRATERPTHYYAYGPTPDNPSPHWYDFSFDGRTGAEIKNDRILLHFADGERGDDDLTADGSVTHSGAQAVLTAVDNGAVQGGGCTITGTPPDATRGDWIAVSLFLAMLAFARRRARGGQHQDVRGDEDTNIASP